MVRIGECNLCCKVLNGLRLLNYFLKRLNNLSLYLPSIIE